MTHEKNKLSLSEKSEKIKHMFDKIAPRYDFLNKILSFRQDVRWRKALLAYVPFVYKGTFYDVATGTGDVLISLKESEKGYGKFIGFDISKGMLDIAKKRVKKKGAHYASLSFIQASAEKLPVEDSSADALSIAFGLRNVDRRDVALKEALRVLKPKGVLLILDFFNPENKILNKAYSFYFKTILPRIGGLLSDKEAYEYLPESVKSMPPPLEFYKLLESTGFQQIEEKRWMGGITRLYVARKK
jgi:demethylmenaquinone methyltransferase/2-methoxy-6-polyprenyl-1,4-benzoquinol methylase